MPDELGMRFGLLTYPYSNNVGDEIQSLAAARFLPRVDRLVARGRMHWHARDPDTFVILNGWFVDDLFWPPPPTIHPLFVSFYEAQPGTVIAPQYAEYYTQFAPIGCRSLMTVEAFHKIGVDAYFSGCLTLTTRPRLRERRDTVYAVDVDADAYVRVVPERIRARAVHVSHTFPPVDRGPVVRTGWRIADFAARATNRIDRSRRLLPSLRDALNRHRHASRMHMAETCLDRYAEARLVITSRLHCALPCLALGTPVVVVRRDIHSNPRFAGLRELVRRFSGDEARIDFDWDHPSPNPEDFKKYADALTARCEAAVRELTD